MIDGLSNDQLLKPETSPVNGTVSGMDDIQAELAKYKSKPMESGEGASVPGTQQSPGPSPFLSHDPTQAPTQQEYYVRGAKKGQPKPPKKGTAPPVNQAHQISVPATALVSGALFITMIDLLLPLLVAGVNNWRSKIKVDADKMKLTNKQLEQLAPLADAVVRELKISASPVPMLLIGLGGIYASNLLLLRSESEKEMIKKAKQEKEKNEKINSVVTPVGGGQGNNIPVY